MVTIRDIAKICGVSIATVSNVLNGKSGVSAETREAVLAKVHELHYTPNSIAKNLKTKKTRMIGVVVEDITIFSVPGIVDGITERCEEAGYRVSLVNLRLYQKHDDSYYYQTHYYEHVEDVINGLAADQVEAIIYIAAEERELSCLPADFHLPLVMSYAYSTTPGVPSVLLAEEAAARELILHAVDRGHRRIGVITGKSSSPHVQQRLDGYRAALTERGIPFEETLIREGDWTRLSGSRYAPELLEQGVSAIFCMNDLMAGGVYDALAAMGLRAGVDVSVLGYDDRIQSEYLAPPLTTVRLPLHDVGYRAAELALEMLHGTPGSALAAETYVPCSLILRESVAEIG